MSPEAVKLISSMQDIGCTAYVLVQAFEPPVECEELVAQGYFEPLNEQRVYKLTGKQYVS